MALMEGSVSQSIEITAVFDIDKVSEFPIVVLKPKAQRRVLKELDDVSRERPDNVELFLDESSPIPKILGFLVGPMDSPYEGGLFSFSMTLPDNYPFRPPTVKFVTKIFHPNISSEGAMCSDFNKRWYPGLHISDVLVELEKVLSKPYFDHGVNTEALIAEESGLFSQMAVDAKMTFAH